MDMVFTKTGKLWLREGRVQCQRVQSVAYPEAFHREIGNLCMVGLRSGVSGWGYSVVANLCLVSYFRTARLCMAVYMQYEDGQSRKRESGERSALVSIVKGGCKYPNCLLLRSLRAASGWGGGQRPGSEL